MGYAQHRTRSTNSFSNSGNTTPHQADLPKIPSTSNNTLHITLDIFVAPTLLWSLTNQAYVLETGIDGIVATNSIDITPQINIVVKQADFTPRPAIEGPIVSPIGLIIAIGVVAVLLTEHLVKTMRR